MNHREVKVMETELSTYNKINKYTVRRGLTKALKYLLLSAISVVYMVPILWMVSTSLKTRADIFAWPTILIPKVPQWDNFRIAFQTVPLLRFMGNSAFLVIINISIVLNTGSVVVPATADTSDISCLVIALITLLFPAFLLPKRPIWTRFALGVLFMKLTSQYTGFRYAQRI